MIETWRETFLNPASEFSPVPFWFWNDQLDKREIARQMSEFRARGIMGFVLHPRIGLPRSIEYLSETFMEYVRFAVEEAQRYAMKVCLYDEGMYPSGSAHGGGGSKES